MRAVELKTLVLATYYKQPVEGVAVEVPDDVEFDPDTMVRRMFDYRLNIKSIMSAPPQGDDSRPSLANIDEIRKSVVILNELKNTPEGKPLVLEDGDFNYLVSRIKQTRWAFIDEGIITFIEDIEHTTAMSKDRIAEAVAKLDNESDDVAVHSDRPPAAPSLIDMKRNGRAKDHTRR